MDEPVREGRALTAEGPLAVDVAVVGGGPTGQLAALCAADAGWQVTLVAPIAAHDPRTTALLMPAVELLHELGVWPLVAQKTAPLVTMRLIDDTGRLPRAPEIAFDAQEVGLEAFGHNVPNDALNEALGAALDDAGAVRIDAAAERFAPGTPGVIDAAGREVHATLVVAADGAESLIRDEAGLGVRRWRYDQSALVTTLSHERGHGNVSTEFHTASGPFTLVPLPGERSSLVWVGRPDEVAHWASLDDAALARAVERRAHLILGRMRVDGPRGTLPMGALIAHRFGANGVVLVGEAAHRFPPIGAQGLNLGMRDCAVLRELLAEARTAQSLPEVPRRYDRRRRLEVGAKTVGVDLLNRSLLTDALPVAAARALGLTAARNLGPLRRTMMRVGLG